MAAFASEFPGISDQVVQNLLRVRGNSFEGSQLLFHFRAIKAKSRTLRHGLLFLQPRPRLRGGG